MNKKLTYYLLIFATIVPASLFSQVDHDNNLKDTSEVVKIPFSNDSLFINNELKSKLFYDTLKSIASKNKFTKTALDWLLVDEAKSGKFIGIEDLRNEEYFNLYQGKTIRNIEIIKLDVFGPTISDTTNTAKNQIERIGNKTHVNTRKFIIRNNLMFSPGDTIDPLLLVDNERLLRELNYIKDASIQIAEIPGSPNYVDILVVTKDVYSAGFYIDLLNTETGVIEVYENNLAGIGHKLQAGLHLSTSENPPTGYEFNYNVNNISNSFITSRFQYLKAFETEKIGIEADRRFFSYTTHWAGGFKLYKTSTLKDIRKTDTVLSDVRLNYLTHDFWLGYSFLLKTKNWQYQNRTRLMLALRYTNNSFFEGPEIRERYNFAYHDNQIILGSVAFSRQRYFKSNLIYGFGKTEDIPIGLLLQFNLGFEADEYYNRPYMGLKASRGAYYPKIGYLNLFGEFGGLYYKDKLEQGVVRFSGQAISNLHYINKIKVREFLSLDYTRGINRFTDEKVYLSSDEIWGLSSDLLYGVQKLSFHSELVAYSDLFIYNFRFLFFGFGDLALIGPENRSVFNNKLYSGIGLGVRIRNENLVFKTFQIKFAFYPVVPADSEQFYMLISGETYEKPRTYEPKAPSVVEFN